MQVETNNHKPLLQRTPWPHVALLGLMVFFLLDRPPNTSFLSYAANLMHPMSKDPLSGMLRTLAVLFFAGYAATIRTTQGKWLGVFRTCTVFLFAFVFVVMPIINDMAVRQAMGVSHDGRPVSIAHDGGVLQTEAALDFMFQGISPYGADYSETDMARGLDSAPRIWTRMGFDSNPAHHFFPYPPLILFLSAPFYAIGKAIHGWYDQRLVYLLALIALAIACIYLARGQKRLESAQAPFLGFVILNPFLARYLPPGRNDIVCLLFLFLTVVALLKNRWVLTSVLLALACGAKQTAWFLVPLFFAMIASESVETDRRSRKKLLIRSAVIFASVSLVVWLPFLIWDAGDLLHDVIVAQGAAYPFRPHGFGITDLLIFFGAIDSHRDALSLLLPGLLLTLAPLGWGCWRVYRNGRLSELLLWFSLSLLTFMFFCRFFAPNHFAVPFTTLLLSALHIKREDKSAQET
jgi:hypothetical protein